MLRFQERYECPNDALRGRSFSLDEYKAWAIGEEQSGFSYYDHWSGFNVPGSIVQAVLAEEDKLMPRERALQQVLQPLAPASGSNFYVIGSCLQSGVYSLPHEFSHGMYELNSRYRADVNRELARIPADLIERMKSYLIGRGYAAVERILQDEVHAYLLEGHPLGCSAVEVMPFAERIRPIFLRHAGE